MMCVWCVVCEQQPSIDPVALSLPCHHHHHISRLERSLKMASSSSPPGSPRLTTAGGGVGNDGGSEVPATQCLKCHSKSIEYETVPCSHPSYCKPCAMKLASGGVCKVCHQLFGELRRVR